MNFIFSCSTQHLSRSLRSLVRYRVEHSKIKFISTRGHVISSIYRLFLPVHSSYDPGATIDNPFRARVKSTTRFKKALLVFFSFRTKNIHISCLFLPPHSCYDQCSLLSKNYEPHAFSRKHFWYFSALRTRNIHIHNVPFKQKL